MYNAGMAYSGEIVDFNNSDGLTPQQVRKLNYNFKALSDRLVPSTVTINQVTVDQARKDIGRELTNEREARLAGDAALDRRITALESKINAMHPVGSTYITFGQEDPADVFRFGTWQLVGEGLYLRATQDNTRVGQTGGAMSQSFRLTANQVPLRSHSHGLVYQVSGGNASDVKVLRNVNAGNPSDPRAENSGLVKVIGDLSQYLTGDYYSGNVAVIHNSDSDPGLYAKGVSADATQNVTVATEPSYVYLKVWRRVS